VRYYESGDQLAYQYAFSDHLGNTRVLAEPDGQGVVQETSYYPYGLQIADLGGGSSTNEELYNGKELTDAHGLGWYHYGARYYDVAIARWTTMDPADQFHSPYTYVGGDPVNLIDPDGRQATSCGNGPRNCENAPVVSVNVQDEPVDFDFSQYSAQLRNRLVDNGYSDFLTVEEGFPNIVDQFRRWWDDTPNAYVTIRDYQLGREDLDKYDPRDGGYAEKWTDEVIVFTGRNTYNQQNRSLPTYLYVNITIHELGHASFGFDDYEGSSNPGSIMNYRNIVNPNARFSEREQAIIRNSKWGVQQ
jgi:RHS repeat-associated protein